MAVDVGGGVGGGVVEDDGNNLGLVDGGRRTKRGTGHRGPPQS